MGGKGHLVANKSGAIALRSKRTKTKTIANEFKREIKEGDSQTLTRHK